MIVVFMLRLVCKTQRVVTATSTLQDTGRDKEPYRSVHINTYQEDDNNKKTIASIDKAKGGGNVHNDSAQLDQR